MTSVVGKYTLLQELKDREAPTYAARCEGESSDTAELVAVERYATESGADPEDEASLTEAARGAEVLTALYHPNLASVRDVVVSEGEVLVVGAFLDGDSYERLMPGGKEFLDFPFALKLAIVADTVEGLAALHEFARAHDATFVHGGVTPRNVIVCADGRARLVRVCNLFPEQVSPASPTLGYIAPELLDPSRRPEPSVDVFGAGVMLWEVLAGKRLAVQTNAPLLLLKEFEKGPPRGIPHDALGWAKAFIPIVERALSPADRRYADGEQMARAMRAVFADAGVGTRPTPAQVAEFVEGVAGDRIRERRAELGFSPAIPITSSRATIAPTMRSRASMPEVPPLPLPPPSPRINLPTMVDEEEFSSRDAIPVTSESSDATQMDLRPPDDALDLPDEVRGSVDEFDPFPGLMRAPIAGTGAGAGTPEVPRPDADSRAAPRGGKRAALWGAVALAAAVAIVFAYGLGRGQKSAIAPSTAPLIAGPAIGSDPEALAEPADTMDIVSPVSNSGIAAVAVPRREEPEAAKSSRASARRPRPGHASPPPASSPPEVSVSPPLPPPPLPPAEPSAPEGRQKFNPQGI